jgi:hypothetical protein
LGAALRGVSAAEGEGGRLAVDRAGEDGGEGAAEELEDGVEVGDELWGVGGEGAGEVDEEDLAEEEDDLRLVAVDNFRGGGDVLEGAGVRGGGG